MTHSWLSGLALVGAFTLAAPVAQTHVLCTGFVKKNDLYIPANTHAKGGITKDDFNSVLDRIQEVYGPIISAHGGTLQINRLWDDGTVNASAEEHGNTWVLNMYGGLARYPTMTKDGFAMVACHETGHHLGGAPKIQSYFGSDWASNEGEADYFASLRCMRNIFTDADNAKFVAENTIDATLMAKCQQLFTTQEERNLCLREGMAGFVGAKTFQDLGKEQTAPAFSTPDMNKVDQTDDEHPATQCRLDTYYAGSVCVHDRTVELSNSDYKVGTCTEATGKTDGVRPHCWFSPSN